MKSIGITFLFLASACCLHWSAPSAAAQAPNLPFRINPDGSVDPRELLKLTRQPTASDRITDEELEAIKAKHEIDYGSGFRATERPEMPPRVDLYASSTLLSDGINHTLLPKDAVIWVPDALKDRVVDVPVGRLILWPDFLKLHRQWLRAEELSLEISEGLTPLTEEQWKRLRQPNVIVVSVHQGNPISLLKPVVPPAESLTAVPLEKGATLAAVTDPDSAVETSGESGDPEVEAAPEKSAGGGLRPDRFDVSNRFGRLTGK